jgi:hypothetical protein
MVVMVWYERATRDLQNRMLIKTSIKGVSVRVKKMTIPRQQHGQPIWNSREKLLCFRVWSCSDPSVVLKTLLLTFLLLLLWRTPPFFMQKISNIHENVQRLAADVPEMKIYIKSGLKSDRFRMHTENFRISHNVCLFFIFGKFSKPMRAGDVKRRIFLGWPKYQFKFRYLVVYQFKLR